MWLKLSVSNLVFYLCGSTFCPVSTKSKMAPFSLASGNEFTEQRVAQLSDRM